jgi:PPOX class probable F420-dependent enzyme
MTALTVPLDRQMDEQLRTAPVGWVSTVRSDGTPHLVPVWFQWDGETILFFAQPGDQKIRNLRHSPRVTFGIALNPEAATVSIIQGEAELTSRESPGPLPAEYVDKYRDQINAYGWNESSMAEQYSVQVRVHPTKMISW